MQVIDNQAILISLGLLSKRYIYCIAILIFSGLSGDDPNNVFSYELIPDS